MNKGISYYQKIYNQTIDNIDQGSAIGEFSQAEADILKAKAIEDLSERLYALEDIDLSDLYSEADYYGEPNMALDYSEFSADLGVALDDIYHGDIEVGVEDLAINSGLHPDIIIDYLNHNLDLDENDFNAITDMLEDGIGISYNDAGMLVEDDEPEYYEPEYYEPEYYAPEYYEPEYYEPEYYEPEYYAPEYYAPEYYEPEYIPSYSAYYDDALAETMGEFAAYIEDLQANVEDMRSSLEDQSLLDDVNRGLMELLTTAENMVESGYMTPAQQEAIFSPDIVFSEDTETMVDTFLDLVERKGSDPYQELEQISDHLEVLSYNGYEDSYRDAAFSQQAYNAVDYENSLLDQIYPGISSMLEEDPSSIWFIN